MVSGGSQSGLWGNVGGWPPCLLRRESSSQKNRKKPWFQAGSGGCGEIWGVFQRVVSGQWSVVSGQWAVGLRRIPWERETRAEPNAGG